MEWLSLKKSSEVFRSIGKSSQGFGRKRGRRTRNFFIINLFVETFVPFQCLGGYFQSREKVDNDASIFKDLGEPALFQQA